MKRGFLISLCKLEQATIDFFGVVFMKMFAHSIQKEDNSFGGE